MANFREEDEELQSIIEAHLANFESFKISTDESKEKVKEENDLDALGSEISATTVEIAFGPTANNTTEMPLDVEGKEGEDMMGETVMEITSTKAPEVQEKEDNKRLEKLEILSNVAKEFLKRKYKKVKKPKKIQDNN